MIRTDIKRMMISATVVVGAAMASAGPVQASDPDALYHYYYSNQDYSESVGEAEDRCNSWGISWHQLWGTTGPNVHSEIWAYCRNGQLSLE
ncbi:MAG TPA: hypothetical protein VEW26_02030 [Allosphingosinicella sp.]|nr:hypothetical protein [Allosphingosinicella sp.]